MSIINEVFRKLKKDNPEVVRIGKVPSNLANVAQEAVSDVFSSLNYSGANMESITLIEGFIPVNNLPTTVVACYALNEAGGPGKIYFSLISLKLKFSATDPKGERRSINEREIEALTYFAIAHEAVEHVNNMRGKKGLNMLNDGKFIGHTQEFKVLHNSYPTENAANAIAHSLTFKKYGTIINWD